MNSTFEETFSVAGAAAICAVGQSTVGYWIRSKGLPAEKVGRGYAISPDDLAFFLKSTGKKIPPVLEKRCTHQPYFKPFRNCWESAENAHRESDCAECVVYREKINVCFSAKGSTRFKCMGPCRDCLYYLDTFFPKIQFIQQLDVPAAVCEELYFWGCNRQWEEACNVVGEDLPGRWIEEIVHPDSMATVLSSVRRRSLGDCDIPRIVGLNFLGKGLEKVPMKILGLILKEPRGCSLIIAERE